VREPASLPAMAEDERQPGGAPPPPADEDKERPEQRRRFQRLGEQLTGLLDPESAFRRGQGIVTGVTQATKEELMRIVSSEVRSFLDKMDAADLLQQVIAGLTVDVSMQIKFSRSEEGRAQSRITRNETKIGMRRDRSSHGGSGSTPGDQGEDT
jgi:hypothetical protein